MMDYEILQPWSVPVMKTRLPPDVLQKMLKITDEIIEESYCYEVKVAKDAIQAGEMKEQFLIDSVKLEQEKVLEYFLEMCKQYVLQAFCQSQPFDKEAILKEKWMTQITIMWINSQKDNEYFPLHAHCEAQLSTVMYLKIPEYLSSNSPYTKPGALEFISNTTRNQIWGVPSLMIQPQVGDFFIFAIDQQHIAYPFQTQGGNGERRSVAFNADFKAI